MHELLWYRLYLNTLTDEAKKQKKIDDTIEFLLPWFNIELWHKIQKDKEKGNDNVTYDQQLAAIMRGEEPPDGTNIELDELEASDVEGHSHNIAEELFRQARSSGPAPPGSIKDTLFNQ